MTFQLIDQEQAHHAVSRLCSVLNVTRQGYWAWKHRPVGRRRVDTGRESAAGARPGTRDFRAERPDQTLVADVTYVPTYEGWLFLAAVMDLYSRKIVGWSMRDNLEAPLVVDAISTAIARRKPKPGLVHHSDRGSQYASIAMGRTLRDSKIMASMGSKGDPWDNACAESCISTINNALVKRRTFQTRDQARLDLLRYIESCYNRSGVTRASRC